MMAPAITPEPSIPPKDEDEEAESIMDDVIEEVAPVIINSLIDACFKSDGGDGDNCGCVSLPSSISFDANKCQRYNLQDILII
ncbi:hypothetical protein Trydic_g3858 [Trypoxylus dichotomus]